MDIILNYQSNIKIMRTKIINSLMLCSIILMCNNSFGQGPGAFYFANNLGCEMKVTIWAYEGECESIQCDSDVGSIGPITVDANSTLNVASGYSGSGDVWGKVLVEFNSLYVSNGSGDCQLDGSIYCDGQKYVQWIGCHDAAIP